MSDTQPKGAIAIGSLPGMRELINVMTQPKEQLIDISEIEKALEAPPKPYGGGLHKQLEEMKNFTRGLLEENKRLETKYHVDMNNYRSQVQTWQQQRDSQIVSLRAELSEKDKVLEWYAVRENFEDTDDLGERARTILQQYKGEDTDAPK
jgi:hypothetical protein